MNSNFDFIKSEFPIISSYGFEAEKTYYENNIEFSNNIRKLLERLSKTIICGDENTITQDIENLDLKDLYKRIKELNIFDKVFIDYMYEIKDYTNQGHHDGNNSRKEISIKDNHECLYKTVYVVTCFYNKFNKFNKTHSFIEIIEPDINNSKKIKIDNLENEVENLKQKNDNKDRIISDLERKVEEVRKSAKSRSTYIEDNFDKFEVFNAILDYFLYHDNKPTKTRIIASYIRNNFPGITKKNINQEIFYSKEYGFYFERVNDDGEYRLIIN